MKVYRRWLIVLAFVLLPFLLLGHVLAQEGDEYDTYLPLVFNGYDPTWQWRVPVTVTLSPPPASAPLMTIDGQGRVHLLWDTNSSKLPKYIYHTYLTASGWTTPTYVAYSLGTSRVMFPPVVGPDGVIHFLWINERTSGEAQRMLYAYFEDDQWKPKGEGEIVHQAETSYYDLQGMVHLDDEGRIHATFVESYFSANIYHYKRASSGWGVATPIYHQGIRYWIWPGQHGGVHFYGNDYQDVLHYSYWRDGEFLVWDREASGIVEDRKSQLDVGNNLHLFWKDLVAIPWGSVNGVYYQCLDSDLNLTEVEVLSEKRDVRKVVKAMGEDRSFALSWQEAVSDTAEVDATRLGVWEGCTRTDLKTTLVDPALNLKALAVSDTPHKVCLLMSDGLDVYTVICADLLD